MPHSHGVAEATEVGRTESINVVTSGLTARRLLLLLFFRIRCWVEESEDDVDAVVAVILCAAGLVVVAVHHDPWPAADQPMRCFETQRRLHGEQRFSCCRSGRPTSATGLCFVEADTWAGDIPRVLKDCENSGRFGGQGWIMGAGIDVAIL